MELWLVKYQNHCRLAAFIIIFLVLALWETKSAAWPWIENRRDRWMRHLGISLTSAIFIRIVFPFMTVTTAWIAHTKGVGYFNRSPAPLAVEALVSLLLLDLIMYFQHRMMHRISLFWRLHRVHHMDRQLDLSTGLRFHPIEAAFTTGFKLLVIAFIGAPVWVVLLYEIMLNAMTMFVHMNIFVAPKTDLWLRWFIVTPNMHRIHHSDFPRETNSNYGFILSCWDKILGSYTARPITGEMKVSVGLQDYRDKKYQTFENMLLIPFNLKRLKVRHKKRLPSRIA
ncbi:MAG: sterol desaturase family protein [Candidatus Berkiella sp.]